MRNETMWYVVKYLAWVQLGVVGALYFASLITWAVDDELGATFPVAVFLTFPALLEMATLNLANQRRSETRR